MSNQAIAWPGGSGKTYTFDVYLISVTMNPGYGGNYIFAKQTTTGWDAVYIGEGDLKDRVDFHRNEGKITKKGATHIHLKVDNDEKRRFEVETDLLAGNQEAYEPKGCNVKKGG